MYDSNTALCVASRDKSDTRPQLVLKVYKILAAVHANAENMARIVARASDEVR